MAPPITRRWVARKTRNTGSNASTDSRTPRMLSTIKTRMSPTSVASLPAPHPAARPPPPPRRGQEAEQGVTGRGDRGGDGQDVIHQQRRAGEHPGALPQQLGGDDVAASAGGELF